MKDMVNSPPHYISKSGLEVIDIIEAFDLDFCRANAIKYILRAPNKGNEIQDLQKSIWYIQRKIKQIHGTINKTAKVPKTQRKNTSKSKRKT